MNVDTKHLATIGYEGVLLEDFISTLHAAGIKRVIDVRELPLSRKRGFSKRALAESLDGAGIEYAHLRALGDPKAGRQAARAGDRSLFLKIYNGHLAGPEATEALNLAQKFAAELPSCLMCYERDYFHCHRNIVALELAKRADVRVRHLIVSVAA